uniref:Olfactory receptor 24-like n=1 Tax=Sinocyclocheilus anshuiensis TaxID=1608454 RepID=A0A671R280_9TELE
MAGNLSNPTFTFHLKIAKFDIHPKAIYPVFLAGALIYVFSVVCNGIILGLIITQRSLHKPMFYILFSLPLTDLIGITGGLPRVLVGILTETNYVYYPTCVLQAFLLHLYADSIPFLLAAMSVDWYIAICNPLRYNSIMTPCKICGIIVLAWGLDFVLILVLFSLQSRMVKCKSFITNVYCDNPSLLLLSCGGDWTVNNIYGLFITAFMQMSSISIQLFSYTQILITCIKETHALNTCIAQIATFFLFETVTTIAIMSFQIPSISSNAQKICGLMIYTVLPTVNPVQGHIRIAFFLDLKKHKVNPGKNTSAKNRK